MWTASKDGDFSTSSANRLANSDQPPEPPFGGVWIGKLTHFLR